MTSPYDYDDPREWPLREQATRLRPPAEPRHELPPEEPDEPVQEEVEEAVVAVEPEIPLTPQPLTPAEPLVPVETPAEPEPQPEPEPVPEAPPAAVAEHADGEFRVPDGYNLLEGAPTGQRRTVGIVVSRFNAEITNRLLQSALDELEEAEVARDAILVMPVPGAFELPLAALALAKTRRYSCIIALGCVIRGETPHFDFVASEAASGLQLAGIESGVPVAFGVLTCDTPEQAEARVGKGAEAVRSALEMADAFAQLRASAAAARTS
jgi:6,7-dimethyl-8-ribityllumazine synthase